MRAGVCDLIAWPAANLPPATLCLLVIPAGHRRTGMHIGGPAVAALHQPLQHHLEAHGLLFRGGRRREERLHSEVKAVGRAPGGRQKCDGIACETGRRRGVAALTAPGAG